MSLRCSLPRKPWTPPDVPLPLRQQLKRGHFFEGGAWLQEKGINIARGLEETTRGSKDKQAAWASRTWGKALGEGWVLGLSLSQRATSHRAAGLVPFMFCKVFRQLATPENAGVRPWAQTSMAPLQYLSPRTQ